MKDLFKFITILFFFFLSFQVFSQEDKITTITNYTQEKKHPLLSDKITFYAGLYSSFKEVRIGANGSLDNNLINFNKTFDFNNNQVTLFLNFNWRFARMWSLSAEYFAVKNEATKKLEKDIVWSHIEFTIGTSVTSGFGLHMYRIMAGRTITEGLKHELGIGLGVHILDINSYLEGNVYLNEIDFEFKKQPATALAPLPNIGFWYFYAPSNKWMMTARVDWLGVSLKKLESNMWNIGLGVNYQLFENFGIGLKYRHFKLATTINKNGWDGKIFLKFQGPLLTLNTNF